MCTINQLIGPMIFRYKVTCWVNPKSGFDLKQRNEAEEFIKNFGKMMVPTKIANEIYMSLSEDHPGMILKDFVIETDHEVINAVEYLLPYIRAEKPEAELANWDKI